MAGHKTDRSDFSIYLAANFTDISIKFKGQYTDISKTRKCQWLCLQKMCHWGIP